MNKIKYYEIQDARGLFVGYAKGKDEVDAHWKVVDHFPGCCPDSYFVQEISKEFIDKEYLYKLKEQDVVEEIL